MSCREWSFGESRLGLFCAETGGAGTFVRSLSVLTWDEALEINPELSAVDKPVAAA